MTSRNAPEGDLTSRGTVSKNLAETAFPDFGGLAPVDERETLDGKGMTPGHRVRIRMRDER
ncbi:MAG: hypothetical protein KTR25_01585 [Myxococcales bacterium]|nr:hypothetical protein [Myxococcales bacterium]